MQLNSISSRLVLVPLQSLCLNNRVLTFKIKLNNFGSLFCAKYFHHKCPKFFQEYSEKKNKKENVNKNFIHLLNHNVTYATLYTFIGWCISNVMI